MSSAPIEGRLSELFPELAIRPARVLETGFGSVALETADGVIFRIARTAGAGSGHALEEALLPTLAERVSAPVPRPEWRVEPGDDVLTFGAIGYRKLPGRPMSPELLGADPQGIASDVGHFLATLHRFPVEEAEQLGVEKDADWNDVIGSLVEEVFPALRRVLTPDENGVLESWGHEALADTEVADFTSALRHGDLWYEQLLVGESPLRLIGVLDWESARIGDPATDFAAQLYLGEGFLEAVTSSYTAAGGQVARNFRHRIERHWQLREFGGIRWSLDQGDAAELEESLEKLRRGPILRRRGSRTR